MNAAQEPFDRFRELMTRALDQNLSAAEEAEFERMLQESADRRQEWEEYKQLKDTMIQMRFKDLPEEVWHKYWASIYNRLERRLAWTLVSIGGMILLFYGGYQAIDEILGDTTLPALIKVSLLALLGGAVILFVSVLREKLFTRRNDKYKDVQL